MARNIVVIDGSFLEGGGQILRNAAALSCLLCQPVTINNIRAGRSQPGLRPQHLTGLQLIRDLCNGCLDGGKVGSTEVTFHPGSIKSGKYLGDTKTAGSICLLLQAALPCLLFADGASQLHLKGGTNAEMAPQIDYFTRVFRPMLQRFGGSFDCDIIRRGYFPKGGGEVMVTTTSVNAPLKAIHLTDRGHVIRVSGRAFVAGVLPIKVAKTMADWAQGKIESSLTDVPVNIETVKESSQQAIGTGTGIIVVAETSTGCLLAGSALGKRGLPAEQVGVQAADMLLHNLAHAGCVDEFLQDQMVILMALAAGESQVKCGPISLHTRTAIHIAQSLTQASFEVRELGQDSNLVTCKGVGNPKQS